MSIYTEYCKLKDRKDELTAELKQIADQLDVYEEAIISDLDGQQATSITKDGYRWTKVVRKNWAKIVDKKLCVFWFWKNDLQDKLTVNQKTLSTFCEDSGEKPDGVEVTDHIELKRSTVK